LPTLGEGMPDREVLDGCRDGVRRVTDEEDAEPVVNAYGQVRRTAAVDHRAVAEDHRQFGGKRDHLVARLPANLIVVPG